MLGSMLAGVWESAGHAGKIGGGGCLLGCISCSLYWGLKFGTDEI